LTEDFLSKIVGEKRAFLKEKKNKVSQDELQKKAQSPRQKRSFREA